MPGVARRSLQDREELVDSLDPPGPWALAEGAETQVLFNRERGEEETPLGHEGDAAAHDLVGRQVADGLALERDLLRRRRQLPDHALEKGRLAGAVGPDDGDGLAASDMDVDAEERLKVAVEGGEVLGREHRLGCRAHSALIPI